VLTDCAGDITDLAAAGHAQAEAVTRLQSDDIASYDLRHETREALRKPAAQAPTFVPFSLTFLARFTGLV
jgi:hypothetical protein